MQEGQWCLEDAGKERNIILPPNGQSLGLVLVTAAALFCSNDLSQFSEKNIHGEFEIPLGMPRSRC